MIEVESSTQVLPSFTGGASSGCLGSAFFFGYTLKQLYLKDERVNSIPSIKKTCLVYLFKTKSTKKI